jgi:hypothetical protein
MYEYTDLSIWLEHQEEALPESLAKIEITVNKYNSEGKDFYKICLGNDLFLGAYLEGFKKPKLRFKEFTKDTIQIGCTFFFNSLEEAAYVAKEYMKSKNAINIKKEYV